MKLQRTVQLQINVMERWQTEWRRQSKPTELATPQPPTHAHVTTQGNTRTESLQLYESAARYQPSKGENKPLSIKFASVKLVISSASEVYFHKLAAMSNLPRRKNALQIGCKPNTLENADDLTKEGCLKQSYLSMP